MKTVPEKNTPELWDNLWDGQARLDYEALFIEEERSIRWRRIEQVVRDRFSSFRDVKVVELGAGMGLYSAFMNSRGADITIVDYSDSALKASSEYFKANGYEATYINRNILDLPQDLCGKFDISMSFGLAEHFLEPERTRIIKSHIDVLKPGGISFISVPNAWNLPYRINKYVAEKTGNWRFGEEYPFTRKELARIANDICISDYFFLGDSFIRSLHFANPGVLFYFIFGFNPITAIFGSSNSRRLNKKKKLERGTPLDKYISHALVFCAVRTNS